MVHASKRMPNFTSTRLETCAIWGGSCHANNMNYVRYWYNDMVSNIVDSDLLQFLLDQISPYKIKIDRELLSRKHLSKLVKESNYGIC